MKMVYLERVKQKRQLDSDDEVDTLPPKKHSSHLLLGDHVDRQLQLYLKKIREQGGVITTSVVVAAARGIVMAGNCSQLAEFGGHVTLSRCWVYHLLMFVRRKATTLKNKYKPTDFDEVKETFLNDVVSVVTMDKIPP